MKKQLILLVLLFCASFISYGQVQINWQQCYGSMSDDVGFDIVETDGGYLVTGMVGSASGHVGCFLGGSAVGGRGGGWLIKIDYLGNLIWQKCYRGAHGIRIVKSIGGPNYYLIGGTKSAFPPYPNRYNLWVAMIDKFGNIIWQQTLGNNIGILGGDQNGVATVDGGVIASGQISSKGGDITNWWGGYDGWIVKLDSLGNKEWDISIGSPQFEFINSIIQTGDGGYLAGLYGAPNGAIGTINCGVQSNNNSQAIVVKLNAVGKIEWYKCYGGSGPDGVSTLLELSDGYLIAAWGSSDDGDLQGGGWHPGWYNNSTNTPTGDVWLIKIDFSGNIIWQKCYGGSMSDGATRIFQSVDGGFVIFGDTSSNDGDVSGNLSSGQLTSIWVFKVNENGVFQWQRCIGGTANEKVYGVVKHNDNKYTVLGRMYVSPTGDVNCSNFIPESSHNYWVFGISVTPVNIVETLPKPNTVNIYPNPANATLNIDFPNGYDIGNSTIEIIDINGKAKLKTKPISSSTQLDIEKLVPGIYLVKIQNDKALMTKMIIIQQ